MKRKVLSILLMGVLIIGLTGCGNSSKDTSNNQSKQTNLQSQSKSEIVKNGTISCITPYSNSGLGNVEDTYIEDSVVIKHIITETNTYDSDDEYKKKCEENKSKENPLWEYYANDKVECDDNSKTITHTKTYIKDENLTEVYDIKQFTKDDGTFDSVSYIEYMEKYKNTCSIK